MAVPGLLSRYFPGHAIIYFLLVCLVPSTATKPGAIFVLVDMTTSRPRLGSIEQNGFQQLRMPACTAKPST